MKDYDAIELIIHKNKQYCIWYTDDQDGVITINDRMLTFSTPGQLQTYADSNKLPYGCNIDAIKGDGPDYIPEWTNEEIQNITEILQDGFRMIKFLI